MIERIQKSLKDGLKATPRATTPKLLLESAWVTLGPPLLLSSRKPNKEELSIPLKDAQGELNELGNET